MGTKMTALQTPAPDAPASESDPFIARAGQHYARLEELERSGQSGTPAYRHERAALRQVQLEQDALADKAFDEALGKAMAEADELLACIADANGRWPGGGA